MNRFELLKELRANFSDSELRDLCLELGIDYEDLPGASKADKARELILYLERRDQLPQMLAICRRLRPNVNWDDEATAPATSAAPSNGQAPAQTSPATILFLAANPMMTAALRLDEEIRAIDRALQGTEYRQHFNLEQQWALRPADLQQCLLRFRPTIVHFSGHGSDAGEIVLQDDTGQPQAVSAQALSRLFALLKDNIRCVVLNACFSAVQARAIAEHIECVVGMSQAIGDAAALNFATAFYQALGYGRDLRTAFELGRSQIDLQGLSEQETPQLLTAPTVDAGSIIVAPKN